MTNSPLLDVTGRRRSPAATAGFLCGRVPHNKGVRVPARSAASRGEAMHSRCCGCIGARLDHSRPPMS